MLTVQNGLDAHISGIDVEAEHRLTRQLGVFLNITHYFTRNERLASGLEQVILNVPSHTWRAGVDVDLGRLSARFSGRFVRDRQDNDFNTPGFPIVDYDDLSVFDATAACRLGATALSERVDQQRLRRVLLREDRLSAAGRFGAGVLPVGVLGL